MAFTSAVSVSAGPAWAGEEIELRGGWSAYRIPVRQFPLPAAERASLLHLLRSLVSQVEDAARQARTLWLLTDNLYKDDQILNLSRNGRAWKPSFGLGRWPDQPPPRMTRPSDILDLAWGEQPREPYHTVVQLGASGATLESAWATMFGLGATTLTLVPGGGRAMMSAVREPLRQDITDESFQHFPFYFPLLNSKGLRMASVEQLHGWLGPADFYLRECEEEHAVLALSRSSPPAWSSTLEKVGLPTRRMPYPRVGQAQEPGPAQT